MEFRLFAQKARNPEAPKSENTRYHMDGYGDWNTHPDYIGGVNAPYIVLIDNGSRFPVATAITLEEARRIREDLKLLQKENESYNVCVYVGIRVLD